MKIKQSQLIFASVFSLVLFYLANRYVALAVTQYNFASALRVANNNFVSSLVSDPIYISLNDKALFAGVVAFVACWLSFLLICTNKKIYRAGEEEGSARWATTKEMQMFKNNDNPDLNMLFTDNAGMATKREKFDLKHDRNLNVLVVGGSGSGKTRYFTKPNLMQLYGNYFVTDPKGTCLDETGHLFRDKGYEVKSFNTINFEKSLPYNPLNYVKTDEEILSFVNCLIANTNGDKKGSSDPFWENSEKLLYCALIGYLRDWANEQDYTLPNLVYLLSLAEAQENDENFESALDLLFKELETGYRTVTQDTNEPTDTPTQSYGLKRTKTQASTSQVPSRLMRNSDMACPYEQQKSGDARGFNPTDDFALNYYNQFKKAAGKTLKSIIISCNVRLAPISLKACSQCLSGTLEYNEEGKLVPTGKCGLQIETLGDKNAPSIIFGIVSDTDPTYRFLLAILMYQTINVLCERALSKYHGKLPVPVSFLLDEFANIGKIPNIEQTISVTRSRNIFLALILQSLAQLDSVYDKDKAAIIKGNCDTQIFLGGTDKDTNEEVSKMLGMQTIDITSHSKNHGGKGGSTSFNKKQRALLLGDEVGRIDRRFALVLVKGAFPYLDKKYPLEAHKRYELVDPSHEGAKYQSLFEYPLYTEAMRINKLYKERKRELRAQEKNMLQSLLNLKRADDKRTYEAQANFKKCTQAYEEAKNKLSICKDLYNTTLNSDDFETTLKERSVYFNSSLKDKD